jgi:predicted DNA-binding transcriptional regulator YafY
LSRQKNQKLKLLYLYRILMENTDEEHPMTVAQMIEELSRYGITAERKSIYDDLEELRSFGADIIYRKAKKHEYYVASRIFELPELKLLADAVASSKFITERKSRQLIKKIESLCSKHEARQLRRQVYVMGRAKTMNEKIYYNVDKIHQAIALDRQISFKYFEYNLKKEKQYRQGGEKYFASPYALSWDDENYYMTAFYEKYGSLSNFRIDKMENVKILEQKRQKLPDDKEFDPAEYSKRVFGMYAGREEKISLQFDNSLIGVALDRFGQDISIIPADENSFIINVHAYISPTFLGWLFGFGRKVRILSPESLVDEFTGFCRESLTLYT